MLLDDLRHEHERIERVLASFHTWATDGGPDEDGAAYLRFFRLWAGRHHHAREEAILFPALTREVGLPADRGPIAALTGDHTAMAAMLDAIEATPSGPERTARVVVYVEALLHHIDAENSVFLPEAERRLRRAGVTDLAGRDADAEEQAAADAGEALAARRPGTLPPILRGEGCPACPAYGVRCDGVEREWWNELEWEEFSARDS